LSTDGGFSWKSSGEIASSTGELGVLGIMFDHTSQGKVYANSFEDGIYESMDGGDNWSLLRGSPKGVLKMTLDNDGILYIVGRMAPKVAKKYENRYLWSRHILWHTR